MYIYVFLQALQSDFFKLTRPKEVYFFKGDKQNK